MLTRRHFVQSLVAGLALPRLAQAAQKRKRIAFIGTDVYQHSHAQHFLDRFSMGYAMNGAWHEPQVEVAGVYLDQFNDKDLGRQRIERYQHKLFPSVTETLTLGGSELAVDGVVIIGEHGKYPKNELGQTLYPRYRWFKEIVQLYERSGRAVPIFNDKHLSTDWNECREMVDDARRLNFPFYAGSSLPVTWRLPSYELPLGAPLVESVCVAYGGIDSYDFHALETAQCMSERRAGGEVGIKSVQAARGQKLFQLLERPERESTRKLFVSALCRSHNLPVETGYPTGPVTYEWARQALPETIGYLIEHLDGFHTAVFMTGIRDFNYAGMLADGQLVGCQMYLPMPGSSATTADFFNPLSYHVEQMFVHGETPYPIERTLLTSGMVIAGVQSLFSDQSPRATPEMAIKYSAPRQSMYWGVTNKV